MSTQTQNATEIEAVENHGVAVELTSDFDTFWFADEFEAGDDLLMTVGSEQGHATVEYTEPADGTMVVDLSDFDRQESLVTLADMSSTGPDHIQHGFFHSIDAVPVDSEAAEFEAETTHVVCECGTVCKEGRGHSIHCAAHDDSDETEEDDEESGEELPHPRDDPDIKYVHEGKRYRTSAGDVFEVVAYDPDGPAGGLVVTEWVDRNSHPRHEFQREVGGTSREVFAEYLDEYDGALQTVNMIRTDVRELRIMEEDPGSYSDMYYGF